MTTDTPRDAARDIATYTVPAHYNVDGRWCAGEGQAPNRFGKCPFGCDHAEHYANDGHTECQDTSGGGAR